MMTKREQAAKAQIMQKLYEAGYGSNSRTGNKVTYTQLLQPFDIHLTSDPKTVAYCEMGKATIVVNENLDIEQVSFIIRHEILHEYLDHLIRIEKHVRQKYKVDPNDKNWMKNYNHQLGNMAADYELSNVAYTDEDKKIAKKIKIGKETVEGLVTDIDHPEWANMTLEQMYDELEKLSDEVKEQLKQLLQNMPQLDRPGDTQQQQIEDIERIADILDEMADDLEQQGDKSNQQQGQKGQKGQKGQEGDKGADGDSDGDEGDDGEDSDEGDAEGDGNSDSETTQGGPSKSKKKSNAKQLRDRAKQLREKANKIRKAANNLSDEVEDSIEDSETDPFRTPEEVEMDADTNRRVAELKKIAKNEQQVAKDLVDLHKEKIYKERERKNTGEINRYKSSSLYKFKISLNDLIKKEVATGKEKTWKRFDKRYAGSGLLRAGRTRLGQNHIPLINVYFDRSGSWDAEKTSDGLKALGVIKEYVRKGQIKVDLYYFSNNVHTDEQSAKNEGGTNGQPIIEHIIKTKPDNVIVMTDSDISDCRTAVQVDGGVYFLFRGGRSQNLVNHLSGKLLTAEFNLDIK